MPPEFPTAHTDPIATPADGSNICPPADRQSEPVPVAPATAGRYRLGDEIARGGMGAVLAARDMVFNRDVAVKVMHDRFAPGSAVTRRFTAEAHITGQLQHPGIPPVHDLGHLPDGRPFLAMKLIKGQTLDAVLSAGDDRIRLLSAFERICEAVGYAHAHGVIHRDLKPANVMIGAFGEVQVMDWGLAKVLAKGGGEARPPGEPEATAPGTAINTARGDADETQAGSILGTPAFMPPEQAMGAVDLIDRRSDVFGLGGLLCAILTGRPPYVGDTAESTRQMAAWGRVDDAFARLDASGADPDLVALCKRCLSRQQSDRPADAGVVAAAVAAIRAAADDRVRRAEVEAAEGRARATEQAKRRRVQAALAAVLAALAAAVGGGLWWTDRQRLERAAERAVANAVERQAVSALLDQAEAALRADRTVDVVTALDQARIRLGAEGPADLRDRLASLDRDRRFVAAFERLTLGWLVFAEDQRRGGQGGESFEQVFRDYGADLTQLSPDEITRRITNSPIRHRLVAALDHWLFNPEGGAAEFYESAPTTGGLFAAMDWRGIRRGFTPIPAKLRPVVVNVLAAADPNDVRTEARRTFGLSDPHDGQPESTIMLTLDVNQHPPDFLAAVCNWRSHRRFNPATLLWAAVRRYPSHLGLYLQLQTHASYRADQLDRVELSLLCSLALRPDSPTLHTTAGNLFRDRGKLLEAAEYYRRAVDLDPRFLLARLRLGLTLWEQGRVAEAAEALRSASEVRSDGPVRRGIIAALEAIERTRSAANPVGECHLWACSELTEFDLEDARDTYYRLDKSHKDVGGATAYLARLAEQAADPAGRLKELGLGHHRSARPGPAITNLHRAVGLRPDPIALAALGRLQLDRGEWQNAAGSLKRAVAGGRATSAVHLDLGWAFMKLNAPDEGVSEFHKAVSESDADPWRCARFSWTFYRARPAGIAAALDVALRTHPDWVNDSGIRHYAVRCDVLAGTGSAADAPPPAARSGHRRRALGRLRDELDALRRSCDLSSNRERDTLRKTISQWLTDADLALVRHPIAIGLLPADEKMGWRAFWSDARALRSSVLSRSNP